MQRSRLGRGAIAGAALFIVLVSGCGDPPPDPSVAPIEVVLDGCQLNRPSVAAGTHDVSVVGTGSVRILDTRGATVVERNNGEPEPTPVAMASGQHTVTCLDAAGKNTGSATLTVTAS
ncbi:hypothetical protein [Nostocoides vanveenii]|uniref:Lipoprotein n=1 Tax=Nostocoides vanveenii TaxID=330835 RepID=A0ABN2KM26_9MICO